MYKDKKVIHIVARGLNGEIGANNKLLWRITEDLKFFKESTLGHVVLMGRKTVESLPKPLDRRIVYCVTRDNGENEYELIDYLEDAEWDSNVLKTDCIFIAGGSQLYESTSDIVDELWITQVNKECPKADRFYQIPNGFEKYYSKVETNCLDRKTLSGVTLEFTKWKRIN